MVDSNFLLIWSPSPFLSFLNTFFQLIFNFPQEISYFTASIWSVKPFPPSPTTKILKQSRNGEFGFSFWYSPPASFFHLWCSLLQQQFGIILNRHSRQFCNHHSRAISPNSHRSSSSVSISFLLTRALVTLLLDSAQFSCSFFSLFFLKSTAVT